MVSTGTQGASSEDDRRPGADTGNQDRFHEDLVGLDPADPEARAFAEHLDRVEQVRPGYTVEGYLGGVRDFAEGANRLGGHHRLTAGILAALILLGVVVAAWDALVFILGVLFG
ncbi:hypothetical protein L6E12_20465 [Actinokineospora sp. PR83]|uniref:hypothetical protein n=1 Tax=Actinokineospora sp. PR83 TaxID=2884908 RepID=UPI001F1C8C5A|nr:hypothetical protein [Actinokineospora sp. PR83]MCG8918160.1 hypothetical protein [Actinokineospora sp. PR83]